MEFYSQIAQDQFVVEQLGHVENGTFLDVGCSDYREINNTYFFELNWNWRGVGVDIEPSHAHGWQQNRKRSAFVLADATAIDYDELLDAHAMPEVIDYLSLDLEPPTLSLVALKQVLQSRRKFRCVTFEHDYYRQKATCEPSRDLMRQAGYRLVMQSIQDDYYVFEGGK